VLQYRTFGYGHSFGILSHYYGREAGLELREDIDTVLEPGMVTTVEPGLYLSPSIKGLPKRWWNIGVRIEDDVLVTASGNEVLSHGAPKTVAEIESHMQLASAA
jgi:Xaa-Pro aminopeptidase